MTFIKEGKTMRYDEVVGLVSNLVGEGILDYLEADEIAGFIKRLFKWHAEKLRECIQLTGYDVRDEEKIFDVAYQLKLIANKDIWQQGEEMIKSADEYPQNAKEKLSDFIRKDLLQEMTRNRTVISEKEKQLGHNQYSIK